MKITQITLVLTATDGSEHVVTRTEEFQWHIPTPVWPRTLRFLTELDEIARKHDGGAKA